ncbi:MAG: aminoacyl-tRNA hydrolase [Verrucomicrobia bacterium]|nr:aminoacyl-tRNA hydrolase [Verrucomicrobiota bacterium]
MEEQFLIVGLGNPGREYARTRHNAGFMLVEKLAERWRLGWSDERKFNSRVAKVGRGGRKVYLSEPQTFMNLSGKAVGRTAEFYKVPPKRVLVLVDDADLPLGQIRLRGKGSSGGHHGIDSIEQHLGTQDFPRLRIGIGRKQSNVREITNYVLGQFGADENELLGKVLTRASDQVESWLDEGIEKAMTKFNGAVDSGRKEK